MPDTRYHKATRANELPGIMPIMITFSQFRRNFLCPGDAMIAGYADRALGKWRKAYVDFHLASCENCRMIVADVVKAQRDADPSAPSPILIQRAMASGVPRPNARRWAWAVAGALAAIIVLAAVPPLLLHKTAPIAQQVPPARTAPLVAKLEPAQSPATPAQEQSVVRGSRSLSPVPVVMSPLPESVLASGTPEFTWNPVANSRRYQVRVVRSDGEPVWKGETDKPTLQIPPNAALKDGAYFAWITAILDDGQLAKSPPVRFQVKR